MTTDLATMTFAELVAFATRARPERSSTVPLWETRIASALAPLRPALSPSPDGTRVHRCDLARAWCALRELPAELVPRALVCEGVRHALHLLLAPLARGSVVALPSDVYPVYAAIAQERAVEVHAFDTWPHLDLEAVLDGCAHAGARVVVLPYPLKLHGRDWTADEHRVAREWLRESPERRLVLDGVYGFGAPMREPALDLIATDQVLLLDSMSKGWLHERTFGVAIVPQRDRDRLTDVVRSASPSAASLHAARELMEQFADTPAKVARAIDERRAWLYEKLDTLGIPAVRCERGYLVTLDASADILLEKHGVLALPASVFGSSRRDRCLASALAPLAELRSG